MELRDRICKYLAACPPAVSGQQGHTQTFMVACKLVNGFALGESDALDYLRLYNERCQPPWSESELVHKIKSALGATHRDVRGHLIGGNGTFSKEDFKCHSTPAAEVRGRPTLIDPVTAIENYLDGWRCSEAEIHEASPIKPSEDFTFDGVLLITHLFRPGEIVNYVTDFNLSDHKDGTKKPVPSGTGISMERDKLIAEWNEMEMPQSDCGGWMRMNPMSGRGARDADVTAHRHILLEFDSIPIALQLSLFSKIPLPISCILTSGGKSLHAWVRADSADATAYKDDATMLLKTLERFGLDGKNKNPSRLSRLVGVTRKLGASGDGRQRLLYLNPHPKQEAICR